MADAPAGDTPPPFQINTVELASVNDSKITGVSVYSGCAEVTRHFKFSVKTGQNQVSIKGLPNVIEQESFRVEGRGSATIHDVTLTHVPRTPAPTSFDAIKALNYKKDRTQNALERAKKAIGSLETYLGTLNAQHVDVKQLSNIMENYDNAGAVLDDKVLDLEKELEDLEAQIGIENVKLSGPVDNEKLRLKAAIGVFAEGEGEVELKLIYAVKFASWHAGYDIRVDMQAKEKPVTLLYKGSITQSTGEDWTDIPLALETATPTFGLGTPTLNRWPLSIYVPVTSRAKSTSRIAVTYTKSLESHKKARVMARRSSRTGESLEEESWYEHGEMARRELTVSSKGAVSSTFGVPGLISIPSDGVAHNVTIVELKLDATMSWVAVPKLDAKTHLSAKIKNASEFTLLPGASGVYVDGSFISRSNVPSVSPDESFDCPLGLDPSIRLIYHPVIKKVSQSWFYTKSTNHHFTQRFTIHNTKSSAVERLKIVDQVPVSENEQITVKMVNPVLQLAAAEVSGALKTPTPVKVAPGVTAQWDGADEPGCDVESLGKDGKINWMCSVPAQEKVNLLLQWEVVVPSKTDVVGLTA